MVHCNGSSGNGKYKKVKKEEIVYLEELRYSSRDDEYEECGSLLEDMTYEECMELKTAVDVLFVMAYLDCSEDDMKEVFGKLYYLFRGKISEIDYTCFNGHRIRILPDDEDEYSLIVITDPPLDDLEEE